MTDIEWEAEEQVMGISSRFFIDDMERALSPEGKVKISMKMDAKNSLLLQTYFLEHFNLKDAKGNVPVTFIGYEVEKDMIWCYAQCNRKPDSKTLSANANWLTELFEDQSNILHLKDGAHLKTVILNRSNPTSSFNY
jgi:hypothetical protein